MSYSLVGFGICLLILGVIIWKLVCECSNAQDEIQHLKSDKAIVCHQRDEFDMLTKTLKDENKSLETNVKKAECDIIGYIKQAVEYKKKLESNEDLLSSKIQDLNKAIKEAEEVKKRATVKHVLVKRPEDDVSYWEAISKILDDSNFQWFVAYQKETLVDQISCIDPEKVFLQNPEQVSGAIKAHDRMVAEMIVFKKRLNEFLLAESTKVEDDEQ